MLVSNTISQSINRAHDRCCTLDGLFDGLERAHRLGTKHQVHDLACSLACRSSTVRLRAFAVSFRVVLGILAIFVTGKLARCCTLDQLPLRLISLSRACLIPAILHNLSRKTFVLDNDELGSRLWRRVCVWRRSPIALATSRTRARVLAAIRTFTGAGLEADQSHGHRRQRGRYELTGVVHHSLDLAEPQITVHHVTSSISISILHETSPAVCGHLTKQSPDLSSPT